MAFSSDCSLETVENRKMFKGIELPIYVYTFITFFSFYLAYLLLYIFEIETIIFISNILIIIYDERIQQLKRVEIRFINF